MATTALAANSHPVAVMTPITSPAIPPAMQSSQPRAVSSRVDVRPSVIAAVNTARGEVVHESRITTSRMPMPSLRRRDAEPLPEQASETRVRTQRHDLEVDEP